MAKKTPPKGQQRQATYNPPFMTRLLGMKSLINESGDKYFYSSAHDKDFQDMKLFQTTVYENGEPKTGIEFIVSLEHTKLISYIIGLFIEQHGYKNLQKLDPNNLTLEATKVEFNVMEYLRYCYNEQAPEISVTRKDSNGNIITAKEKRPNPDEFTDEQFNNQLKKLKNRLDTIASYHLTFYAKSSKPTAKKKGLTKVDIVFLQGGKEYHRDSRSITLHIDQTFFKYLIEFASLNWISNKYLKTLSSNEFILFFIISWHYEINIHKTKEDQRKSANKLAIKSLLRGLIIQHYEEIKTEHSWRERIEEPLYEALAGLKEIGFIKEYQQTENSLEQYGEYTKIKKYEDWIETMFEFDLDIPLFESDFQLRKED